MPFHKKLVRITLIIMVAVVSGCTGSVSSESLEALANASLAQIDGELQVPGLREPVEVIRD